jgi:hypothetical protein
MMTPVNDVSWAEYVRAVTGADSGRAVAQMIGQSESAISRWKNGTVVPEPRQAVAFARAYERNPLEALIAAGYLSDEEAAQPLDPPRTLHLRDFTDLELATEMVRRVDTDPREHDVLTRPLDNEHPAIRPDDE